MVVQGACDQFLAGAGLAGNQHRHVAGRQPADQANQLLKGRGRADHAGIAIGLLSRLGRRLQGLFDQAADLVEIEGLGQEFEGAATESANGRIQVGVAVMMITGRPE
jgi:hypothetical protein